jgi:hypothetical protein
VILRRRHGLAALVDAMRQQLQVLVFGATVPAASGRLKTPVRDWQSTHVACAWFSIRFAFGTVTSVAKTSDSTQNALAKTGMLAQRLLGHAIVLDDALSRTVNVYRISFSRVPLYTLALIDLHSERSVIWHFAIYIYRRLSSPQYSE